MPVARTAAAVSNAVRKAGNRINPMDDSDGFNRRAGSSTNTSTSPT